MRICSRARVGVSLGWAANDTAQLAMIATQMAQRRAISRAFRQFAIALHFAALPCCLPTAAAERRLNYCVAFFRMFMHKHFEIVDGDGDFFFDPADDFCPSTRKLNRDFVERLDWPLKQSFYGRTRDP